MQILSPIKALMIFIATGGATNATRDSIDVDTAIHTRHQAAIDAIVNQKDSVLLNEIILRTEPFRRNTVRQVLREWASRQKNDLSVLDFEKIAGDIAPVVAALYGDKSTDRPDGTRFAAPDRDRFNT